MTHEKEKGHKNI